MGELSLFYLLHTKINIEMAVQINGVRIEEGPLYLVLGKSVSS